MNNEVQICKCCGKEILSGKYCKMCAAERKERREKTGKMIRDCLGILGGLAIMIVPGVLRKK